MSWETYPRGNGAELSLLRLPRELRDIIYTKLLYVPQSPPLSPADAGPRYTEFNDRIGICTVHLAAERFPEHIHLNLLLCCRQINGEFSQLLALQNSLRHNQEFALDCMFMEKALWATWRVYPGLYTTNIRNLRIDLRFWPNGNRSLRSYLRYLLPAMCCLVDRFLHCGPRLTATPPSPGCIRYDVQIDTLRINISSESSMMRRPSDSIAVTTLFHKFGEFLARRRDERASADIVLGKVSKVKLRCQHYATRYHFEEKPIL